MKKTKKLFQIWHDETNIKKTNIIKMRKKDTWEMVPLDHVGYVLKHIIDTQPEIGGLQLKIQQQMGLLIDTWNYGIWYSFNIMRK